MFYAIKFNDNFSFSVINKKQKVVVENLTLDQALHVYDELNRLEQIINILGEDSE